MSGIILSIIVLQMKVEILSGLWEESEIYMTKYLAGRRQKAQQPALQNVYHGIKNQIQNRIAVSELDDCHELVLIAVDHFRSIVKNNGVACGDVVMNCLIDLIDIRLGSQCIF